MTPEEMQKEIQTLKKELAEVKNYTSNLGGSLEFKKLVQRYATNDSNAIQTIKNLSVTQTLGLFGTTPVGQQADIVAPTGGATVDTEARTAINSIRTVLDNFGFTA